MPEPLEKRYWDATVFLAWIKDEANRADVCEAIIGDARDGRCVIYTSMITLAEVTKTRRGPVQVGRDVEERIAQFFQNDYIKLIPVDQVIGTRARRLIWDFPFLGPRDAIHLATALQIGADALEHYDDDDFGRVSRLVSEQQLQGFPPVRHPHWTGQLTLQETPPSDPPPESN